MPLDRHNCVRRRAINNESSNRKNSPTIDANVDEIKSQLVSSRRRNEASAASKQRLWIGTGKTTNGPIRERRPTKWTPRPITAANGVDRRPARRTPIDRFDWPTGPRPDERGASSTNQSARTASYATDASTLQDADPPL